MQYRSLNQNAPSVSFKEAVINGLAPDKGLYFPSEIPQLEISFIENLEKFSNEEIAFTVIKPFVNNEIPDLELKEIIKETLCFDFPTVAITHSIIPSNYTTDQRWHLKMWVLVLWLDVWLISTRITPIKKILF
jgi:threonine synthase